MSKKHYRAENAGHAVAGVRFIVCDIVAGTAVGVHATDKEDEQVALEKDPRVSVISAEDYESYLKKKARAPGLDNFQVLNPPSPPSNFPLKGRGAAVVIETSDEPEAPVQINPSEQKAEDALTLGVVRDPEPAEVAPEPPPAPKPAGKPGKKGK